MSSPRCPARDVAVDVRRGRLTVGGAGFSDAAIHAAVAGAGYEVIA